MVGCVKIVVQVKLTPDAVQEPAVERTLQAANEAAAWVSSASFDRKLSRKGILERREDDEDRRRKIISIADAHRDAINDSLGRGAGAWRKALAPLTAEQRRMFIDTLAAYEAALGEG